MSKDNLLRLLVVFDAQDEAQRLINALRNAGYIVRDMPAEDGEDVRAAIADHPLDLVLTRPRGEALSARETLKIVAESGRDIPLIVITDAGDASPPLELLQAGARDAVPLDQPERLRHVVGRELGDLHERRTHRQCESMLYETEKRARALVENSRDAIAYVHDGMHIYANQAYGKMFGFEDTEEIQGAPIMDMVAASDHAKFKEFLRGYGKGDVQDSSLDVRGQSTDGREFDITMEFSPASMEGEACTQIVIRDQSLNRELEKKLNVLSKQDLLTGLYNRSYFLEQLDKLAHKAVSGAARGALLYINLDKFKEAKEQVGISGSDLYVADVATLFSSRLGDKGVLARFDGPVFTLLMPGLDLGEAEKLAGAVCRLVGEHISDVDGTSLTGTVSIGISAVNETTASGQEALGRAEAACELARGAGGNRAHVHNPAVAELAEREELLQWADRVKEALRQNRFRLLYQPIVSLHGEAGEHYEVLVRMLDEAGKDIAPGEFLPAAEQMGLMHYVDRWVISRAFKMQADRRQEGKTGTRFFIKLGAASITDENLLPWLVERIKALRLDADKLVFEINEQNALNHLNQAKQLVKALRELNCRIALGGFGTEPNTFNALKHLDVNYLKIHGSLIANLVQNVEHQERVKAITEQAREMGKQTIATFVEDANSLALLWQCAVDFIQGHFLQEPEENLSYDFDSMG